jgi:predicted MFS family arabinose efflux permease
LGLSRDNAWLAMSTLLYGAAVGFYQYVIPLYVADLGATPDQVGLALAVGNSGGIIGLLVGGVIVSRFRYRPQIVLSWLVTALSGVLFVIAPSWQIVALALLLSTLSLFGIPAYNAYIVLARDGQDTAEALTVVNVGFTVGTALTPALGGLLIATLGMRPMFAASLGCIALSTVASAIIRDRPHDADLSVTGKTRAAGQPWYVATAASYREALNHRPIRNLLILVSGLYLSTFVGVALLPNYLHDRVGLDPAAVGALGTGVAVVGVIASLALARWTRRLGDYRALALAEGILVVGFAMALVAPSLGTWATAAGGAGFAFRGGVQAQQILARASIAAVAPGDRIGPSFALLSLVFNTAQTVGPALAGPAYTVDPALPIVFGLVTGVPLMVWLVSRRRVHDPLPIREGEDRTPGGQSQTTEAMSKAIKEQEEIA